VSCRISATAKGWRFCFIGGIAVQRWGEPRFTADADLTLLTGFGGEESFIDALCAHFRPRRADAPQFALSSRVVLLEAGNGIPLDVALGAIPFEVNSVERASPFTIAEGRILTTCSAEDLLVHKIIANREKDWIDIEGVLVRQWNKLDLGLFRTEVLPLVELHESPDLLERFERLQDRLRRQLAS
jgi:hypothetical protein